MSIKFGELENTLKVLEHKPVEVDVIGKIYGQHFFDNFEFYTEGKDEKDLTFSSEAEENYLRLDISSITAVNKQQIGDTVNVLLQLGDMNIQIYNY